MVGGIILQHTCLFDDMFLSSKNFYTTISDVQEEEYDDSTVDNSELTYVIEREEALWNEEVLKSEYERKYFLSLQFIEASQKAEDLCIRLRTMLGKSNDPDSSSKTTRVGENRTKIC